MMMKYLLVIALAILTNIKLTAQEFLSFPDGTSFFDVPGSTFLTARQIDLTTLITEHNEDGTVIWTDSVDFPDWGVSNPIYFVNGIQKFGESNNYLVSVCTPNVTTLPWHLSPTIHLAVKVSTELQAITDTTSMELNGIYIKSASKNDSIITIHPYRFVQNTSNGYETIEVDDSLESTFIAPSDSIYAYGYSTNHSFAYKEDTLYSYFYGPGSLGLTKYDEYISVKDFFYFNFSSELGAFDHTYYKLNLNDSIFGINYCTTSGSVTHWNLTWLTDNLELISEATFSPIELNAPTGNIGIYYHYELMSNCVEVSSEFIYVLANLNNTQRSNLTVSVYNHNFIEVCRFPLNTNYSDDKRLVSINGQVYYRKANGTGGHDYHLIDGCEFNYVGIDETNVSDFAIYPNPSQNIFNIQNPKNERLQIRAMSMHGKEIVSSMSSSTNVQIDLADYPSGVYLLEITTDKGRRTQKVLKL